MASIMLTRQLGQASYTAKQIEASPKQFRRAFEKLSMVSMGMNGVPGASSNGNAVPGVPRAVPESSD